MRELGKSRRWLAKQTGLSGATLSNLLGSPDGTRPPTQRTSSAAGTISKALDLPLPEEFYGHDRDDLQPFRDLKARDPYAYQDIKRRALLILEGLGPRVQDPDDDS